MANNGSIQMISSLIFGIIFGVLMNRTNIHFAPIIREQMLFKRLIMLKMFVSAVGMSMLSVVILMIFNRAAYEKVLQGFIQKTNRMDAFQLILGGSLIGIGMVLAGSCPGTIFIQIGSGLSNSFITAIGACCGVLCYYLFVQQLFKRNKISQSSIVFQQLPSVFHMDRFYLNLIIGLIMLMIGYVLELLIPSKNESIQSNNWSPVFCGIGIGLLQLLFMIFLGKSLGISTGFSVITGQLYRIKSLEKYLTPLKSFTYGTENVVTVLFSLGAILGSFLCSYSSNEFPLNSQYGAKLTSSFLGGFFLLLGARCAGGCTSGQGISGLSHLLIGSFLATASMFAGGIIFALTYGLSTQDWQFNQL